MAKALYYRGAAYRKQAASQRCKAACTADARDSSLESDAWHGNERSFLAIPGFRSGAGTGAPGSSLSGITPAQTSLSRSLSGSSGGGICLTLVDSQGKVRPVLSGGR